MNKVEKVSVLRLDFDTFGVIQQWSVIASKISVCFKKSFNIIFDNTYNTLSPSLNLGFCVGGVDLDILKPDDGLKIYKTEKLFENNFVWGRIDFESENLFTQPPLFIFDFSAKDETL